MTIFGNVRLGRIGYAVMIILMLAFDFAKAPIERYIVRAHDDVAEQLLAPRPVPKDFDSASNQINGREMPFMLKAHEDIVRDIVKSGRKMSKEQLQAEIGRRLAELPPTAALPFVTNKAVPEEIKQLDRLRTTLAAAYPVAVIIMTGVTILALLYMLSARLRDIGWPQYYLWLILAPVMLPKFLQVPLPPLAIQGLGWLFYFAVMVLALIPSARDGDTAEPVTHVPDAAAPKTSTASKPVQFGRLGAR